MRHHERDDHKKTVETAAERIHDRELLGGHRQLEGLRRHHDNRVAHLFGFSWDLTQCVFSSKSCCSIVTDKNLQSVLGVYSSSPHAPGKFSN